MFFQKNIPKTIQRCDYLSLNRKPQWEGASGSIHNGYTANPMHDEIFLSGKPNDPKPALANEQGVLRRFLQSGLRLAFMVHPSSLAGRVLSRRSTKHDPPFSQSHLDEPPNKTDPLCPAFDGHNGMIWPENADSGPNDRVAIQERLGLLHHYLPGDADKSGGSILAGLNPQSEDRTRDGSFTGALLDHLSHAGEPHAIASGPRLAPSAHTGSQYTDMLDRKQNGPSSDKPLFAYVGFEFPHTPVLPPAEFRKKFEKLKYAIPTLTAEELAAFPPQLKKLFKNSQSDHFTDAEKHQMIVDYYALCFYGDSLVGRAVDGFIDYSENQQRPWMVLYVCGDHGWRLNEHGMVSKFSHYDIDLHNPIIVVSSDKIMFPAGKVVEDFTCFVDMAPTFLTAADIDISTSEYDYLDGRDLSKTAAGALRPRDYIIAEPTWVIGPRAVIRTKDYKFAMKIRGRTGHTMTTATAGKDFQWAITADLQDIEPTLFDLRSDPDEVHNVAFDQRYRPVLDALRAKLQDIVLGDGRVEIAWTKTGKNLPVHHSNFAPGADDGHLEVPSVASN